VRALVDVGRKRSLFYVTGAEAAKWGLAHESDVRVRFGCEVATATVLVRQEGDGVRMSPMLRARLYFPNSYRGKLVYHANRGELQVGPLIGLLTVAASGQEGTHDASLFRGLWREGMALGAMVYAFAPHDVDWSQRLVRGWVERRGGAERMVLPLPDVIYNRVPNRSLERTLHYRRFLRQLAEVKHTYMFNPRFFDKWQVHRWLSAMQESRQYLPETRLLASVRDMERILLRHGQAYVKPLGGSLGKGIVRVARGREGGYTVSYRLGERNLEHLHANFAEAAADVYLAKHRRRYLVQQGVTIARYHGRVFDVRVTLHRNGQGDWEVVGPAAKVAAVGAVTTHVHSGGRVYPLKKVLREVFPRDDSAVYERVLEASTKIARAIEKASHLPLGELGLDLGLTPQGEVHLFEVNARPGRMVFAPVWAKRDGRRSLHYICAFAHYVAGFGPIS